MLIVITGPEGQIALARIRRTMPPTGLVMRTTFDVYFPATAQVESISRN